MSILAWILVGLAAGWLASMVMKGGGSGIVGDIVLGIIGALVGGFLGSALFGRDLITGFDLMTVLVAFAGAVVVIAVARLMTGRQTSSGL